MVSQGRNALVVLIVALVLGYWYTSSDSDSENDSYVTLEQLDSIRYTPKMERKLTAFVVGATGAVGKEIVNALANESRFGKVTLIGRRPVPLNPEENPGHKKIENQVVDFDKLDDYKDAFKGFDVGFSALGTTRAKSNPAEYYRIDHDYAVHAAKLAKEGGCSHYHVVTAMGADKNSFFTYGKTKGQVEDELTQLGFPRLSIYRPGQLLVPGGREGAGVWEKAASMVFKPFDSMSVDVPLFGKVIVANCFRESSSKSNVEILGNSAINKFGKEMAKGQVPPTPQASGTSNTTT